MLCTYAALFLLVVRAVQADYKKNYIKVEDYATDDVDPEEEEDWSAGARSSLQNLESELDKKMQQRMQKEEEARLAQEKSSTMTQPDVKDHDAFQDDIVQEDSGPMHSKLAEFQKAETLRKRWKELAAELHAARVEEFLDEIPQMPKTLIRLESEVARLQNIKKMEGLGQQVGEVATNGEVATTKSKLLHMSAAGHKFQGVGREQRFSAVQAEIASLKRKVEAAHSSVADSMRVFDKAVTKVKTAKDSLAEADKLWKDSQKELRGRDAKFAQKERAHLEQTYQTMVTLKEVEEKKLAQNKVTQEELSGQLMLTSVSAAMQEAHVDDGSLEIFTDRLRNDLEKNELDIEEFLRYVKQEKSFKNPKYLAGWGLFKRGPASISAEPLASALKQLSVDADADVLAAKLYGALCKECGRTGREL